MQKLEIILQIFSGGFSAKTVSYETVEKKLLSVLPKLPVSKVIMGWSKNMMLYEKTADFLVKNNIDFYLWFSVFSETGALKDQSPLVDFLGQQHKRPKDHADEDFTFCCPNDPVNIKNILDIFEENFSTIPFTGIFLDKIRYPSFAQGEKPGDKPGSVFTCFCSHCKAEYEKENFDIDKLIYNTSQFKSITLNSASAPLGITTYKGNGEYEFEDPVMSRFFSLKADFIFRKMQQICNFFREKGFAIGLDVFAPFLSPFVGQNLLKLSNLADFMKPMMYRLTNAPAGLPFEMEAMLSGTGSINTIQAQDFYKLLNFNPNKKVFDLEFTVNELRNLVSASSCPIHAGMEINHIKNLAEITPPYIEETIKAYTDAGVQGLVLSWDLLEAPEENVEKVVEVINGL